MTAGSSVSPTTASKHGAARDVLSDEDPDDPLIAAKRREQQQAAHAEYIEARIQLRRRTEDSGLPKFRISSARGSLVQVVVQVPFMVTGAVSVISAAAATTLAFLAAAAEGWAFQPFHKMRRALRNSPTRAADTLVYHFDVAGACLDWSRTAYSKMRFLRLLGQFRTTRAVHRAIEKTIAALDHPETDATARALLPKLAGLVAETAQSGRVHWRSQRRHLNRLFDAARQSKDPAIAEVLYREVVASTEVSLALLRSELADADTFLPIRTQVAVLVRATRNDHKVERQRRRGRYAAAHELERSDRDILDSLPAALRGDRGFTRRILRQARRVQTLAEAELQIVANLDLAPSVVGVVRGESGVPARLAATERVAEVRAIRYRLGDPSVTREQLIDDAREVAFLAAVQTGVPATVAERNAARMEAAGITFDDLRATVAERTVAALPSADAGTRVSAERIGEIFADAQTSGAAVRDVGRSVPIRH